MLDLRSSIIVEKTPMVGDRIMPDGDIVHSRLRRFYQKPYEWLCEGKATSDECARVLMQALKQDIVNKGNLPIQLAQSMAQILDPAISLAGETGSAEWAFLNVKVDRLVQQADGPHRLKEFVRLAGKSLLHDLRYGQKVAPDSSTSEAILQRYMKTVYESQFKERVPLTSAHYAGIDRATLSQRIEEIEPNINAAVNEWAKTANEYQSIEKLRMPRRSSRKAVDLNEDLLGG